MSLTFSPKSRPLNSNLANPGTDETPVNIGGFIEGYEDEKGDFEPTPLLERASAPTHPGAILRELYLPSAGITQGALAQRIGVSRRTISMLVNESRPVTADMANRLARAFSTSPEFWLKLQANHDAWEVAHVNRAQYEQIEPLQRVAA